MAEWPMPDRILLCAGPCRGEFYLPLDPAFEPVCPNDREHPISVYELADPHRERLLAALREIRNAEDDFTATGRIVHDIIDRALDDVGESLSDGSDTRKDADG